MHLLLTVNAGSSSIRLGAFELADDAAPRRLAAAHHEGAALADPAQLLANFLARLPTAHTVTTVHRVVHGGARLTAPCAIDANVEAELARLAPLAPLHNPPALAWLGHCRAALGPTSDQLAVFDTGFFAALPAAARTYALPHDLAEAHGLRRFGFHGLAHAALWRAWRARAGDGGKVITLQLGSGCSVAAIDAGRVQETSMGYSPLEGLVMGTRAGDVDAGILLALQRAAGLGTDELDHLLTRQSGLLGLSGVSADMRELLANPTPRAALAIDVFCHRARKYLGAYLAVLGGADGILLGGGIGEHAPVIRARILGGFEWAGLDLDPHANAALDMHGGVISRPGSRIAVHVVPVDEAQELAHAARDFLRMAA